MCLTWACVLLLGVFFFFFFFFSHSHDLPQTPRWWVGFDVGFGGGGYYFWVILVVTNWFVAKFSWWLVVADFCKRRENCVIVTQRHRLVELRSGIVCVKMEYGDLREGAGR